MRSGFGDEWFIFVKAKDNVPSWYGILTTEEIEAIWAYIRATVDKSKSTGV